MEGVRETRKTDGISGNRKKQLQAEMEWERRKRGETYLETTSNFSSNSPFLFSNWSSWACSTIYDNHHHHCHQHYHQHHCHHHHHHCHQHHHQHHHQDVHLHQLSLTLKEVSALTLIELSHLQFIIYDGPTPISNIQHQCIRVLSEPASPQEWQAVVRASPPPLLLPLLLLLHHLPLQLQGNSPETPLRQPDHHVTLG